MAVERSDSEIKNLNFKDDTISKTLATFRVRQQMRKALLMLQSNIFLPNVKRGGELEELLIKECTFYTNGQTIFMYVMIAVNVTSSVIQVLITRLTYSNSQHWFLPYGGFTVFNVTYSPNYEVACFYQFLVVPAIGAGAVTTTTLIAGVMAHISYQFKVLQNFIGNSVDYSDKKMKQNDINENRAQLCQDPSKIRWKYLKQTLKEIVEYHTAIIDLAKKFEGLLNFPALVDFLGLSVVICLALFACIVNPKINLHLTNQLLLGMGNVFLQFVTAYWGNQVIAESEAVIRACYEADFVGVDQRFQKGLIAVMERSHKPIYFTVGTFAPLSLNTFLKVTQSAYSYLMMLHNFNEK